MHFLDNQHPITTLVMLIDMLRNPNRFTHRSLGHGMPLNVARTPLAWLSKQDEYTGMELIRASKHIGAAKLNAVRIVAKAYQPLFFELAGSDRADSRYRCSQGPHSVFLHNCRGCGGWDNDFNELPSSEA
jgi:hypothetical protein